MRTIGMDTFRMQVDIFTENFLAKQILVMVKGMMKYIVLLRENA